MGKKYLLDPPHIFLSFGLLEKPGVSAKSTNMSGIASLHFLLLQLQHMS
jgi:hypothetical protein